MVDLQEIAQTLQEAKKEDSSVKKGKKRGRKTTNKLKNVEFVNNKEKEKENEEIVSETGVYVQFNCTTFVHMIPDADYHTEKQSLREMRFKDYKSYCLRLAAGSPYETKSFKAGDKALIPNWYYDAHKDDMVKISIAVDNFKNKAGLRTPFIGSEAVKHRYIQYETDTMQKVKKFEKLERQVEEL